MLIIGQLKRLKMCLLLEESLLWTFLAHHKRIIIPFLSCNPTYGEQCPPCCSLPDFSFCLWKGVTIVPICKPYIFYRSDLLNTEIIITAALKPFIFSPKSVGIYRGRLQRLRKHNHHKPIPLLSNQAVPPTATSNTAAVSTNDQTTRRWSRRTQSLQHKLIG